MEEVLEACNHVEGTAPVLNISHIHARGHGDSGLAKITSSLIKPGDLRRVYLYCHFAEELQMGNALHYTQIKKSDLSSSHSLNI